MSDRDPRDDEFRLSETTVLKNGETGVEYQLESCLGSGSFGVVYAARQLGEPIAAAWSPDQSQGLVIKVRERPISTHVYEPTHTYAHA